MSIIETLTPKPGARILVTGGGAGIGRRIAEGFLEAGARVHVSDLDPAAVAGFTRGEGRTGEVSDARDPDATAALAAAAAEALGGLDVVIANAGVAGPTAPVDAFGREAWDETLEVNLRGVWALAAAAAPHLRASRGLFLATSSVAGRLGYANRTPYAASKWGVVGLVKSLAVELGPEGVRANAILPGIVEGPRIERVIAARARAEGRSVEETRRLYLDKVSLRRMVTADEVAAACLYLASPAGSAVTGQALCVCAGVETL
jgi:NAD(P)-dependent dehydrogenase (short-subunit alcohol dehydrogenase family)